MAKNNSRKSKRPYKGYCKKDAWAQYFEHIAPLLPDDLASFQSAVTKGRPWHALTINTKKISIEEFLAIFPISLIPVPWCDHSFYIEDKSFVTKHPFYYAGLYYIQEPSATLPASFLDFSGTTTPVVMDFCAAPGGKSMQISSMMPEEGILVSNDVSWSRARIILRHAERYGLRNFVLLVEDFSEDQLSFSFSHALVDAPCSGEGMVRKDDKALEAWINKPPETYQSLQKKLLAQAVSHATEQVVYSTCTFNRIENEEVVQKYDPIIRRIWPHVEDGEGHFAACLKGGDNRPLSLNTMSSSPAPDYFMQMILSYVKPKHHPLFEGRYEWMQESLYLRPTVTLPLQHLRVMRHGLKVANATKHKIEPSQALAHYMPRYGYQNSIDYSMGDLSVIKYLKGESLPVEGRSDGLYLITVEGFGLGWATIKNKIFKNQYLASWRMRS